MTCKIFDTALADYITGRLSSEQTAAMNSHVSGCALCDSLLKRERLIAESFGVLRAAQTSTDIWARVQTNLEEPTRAVRRPVAKLRWAVASGVGVCAVAAGMMFSTFTPAVRTAHPTVTGEDRPVVQLASELDRLPDPDQEGAFKGTEAREALFGTGR